MKFAKHLLLFCLLFSLSQSLQAQHSCGTQMGRSAWLQEYQKNPIAFRGGGDTLIWVPITIHILGEDSGIGYFSDEKVYDALCQLNADYAEAKIQFYLREDFRYINSTLYNNHPDIPTGAEMMFEYNVDSTMNCYFVDSPSGYCGYNLPYAGMAVSENCAGPGDHTFAHEMGHGLSLPHPFLGWEGGVSYDNSINHNYNDPAPEFVVIDYTLFKDQLFLDTLILDTVMVEKRDGSNCHEAADGFCDTAADYIAYRWACDTNNESTLTQTDPNGVRFISEGKYIMSYSLDPCQSIFSAEQIAAMRANLLGPKAHLLNRDNPSEAVSELSTLLSPEEGGDVQFDNAELSWTAVPNATKYHLRVYIHIASNVVYWSDQIVEDTTVLLSSLPLNRTFSWDIAALSNSTFCFNYSDQQTFQTTSSVAVRYLEKIGAYEVFPNILKNQDVNIRVQAERASQLEIGLYDLSGRLVQQLQFSQLPGEQNFQMNTSDLPMGMYLLRIGAGEQQLVEKLIVQ